MTRAGGGAGREAARIRRRMRGMADGEKAKTLQGFFKTGPGEYGEGDVFLGLTVPQVRELAAHYRTLDLDEARLLLRSPEHEVRLLSLLILLERYRREEGLRDRIYRLYLDSTDSINNWDLVDITAEHIVGAHLRQRSRAPLRRLARSRSLWERRIAVLSTFHFIKRNEFAETIGIAKMLLQDREDLIHKAVGWMLREVGKRDRTVLESFLDEHGALMPRTMLRYAVERLPEGAKKRYLSAGRTPRRGKNTTRQKCEKSS